MQHGPGWCPGRRLRGSYLDQVSVYHGGPDLQGPGRSRRVTRADLALAFAAEAWRVLAVLAPGIELLGHGHIVVLPGSVHVSGQTYDITDSRAHAELPAWLANLARTRPATPATHPISRLDGLPAWFPQHIPAGSRHLTLTRLAGWLRGCGLDELAILDVIRDVTRTRVEQTPTDPITDGWLRRLATWAGRLPTVWRPIRL